MMLRINWKLVVIVVSILFSTAFAHACPDCVINNYLFSSLRSSSNVYSGVVLSSIGEYKQRIRVGAVYRGTNVVGSEVDFSGGYFKPDRIGKKFIFSDPNSYEQKYDQLPIELEWEVKFILRKPWAEPDRHPVDGVFKDNMMTIPEVYHKMDALRAAQGVSRVTRQIGLEYIAQHPECVDVIALEAIRLQKELVENPQKREWVYCNEGLAMAYWAANPSAAASHYKEYIQSFSQRAHGVPNNKYETALPTVEEEYLAAAIRGSEDYKIQKDALRQELEKILPSIQDQSLTGLIYAAGKSKIFSETELDKIVQHISQKNQNNRKACSIGYLKIACRYGMVWDFKPAKSFLEKAKQYADDPDLKELIKSRETWFKKFGR